jgi:hypothetical protein
MQLAFPRNGAEADRGESGFEGEIPEGINGTGKVIGQVGI